MYRPKEREDLFKPSIFSIILLTAEGEIVASSKEQNTSNFFHTLLVTKPNINSKSFIIVIDVCWDPSVSL